MKKFYFLFFFLLCGSFVFAQVGAEQSSTQKKHSLLEEIDGFRMYPNPVTNGNLFINTYLDHHKEIHIFDVLGKKVLSKTLEKNKHRLNVLALKSGIYILKVTENNKTATRKLVIQ